MIDWLPIVRELGGLGIAALLAWKVYTALEKNTRVLYRIEGWLQHREASHETPPSRRI